MCTELRALVLAHKCQKYALMFYNNYTLYYFNKFQNPNFLSYTYNNILGTKYTMSFKQIVRYKYVSSSLLLILKELEKRVTVCAYTRYSFKSCLNQTRM